MTHDDATGRGLTRSAFLRGAAGAAGATVGTGLALGAAGTAAAAPGRQALTVDKIKNLTGPGLTTAYRMEATDLGVPVRIPDGRTLYVFGDTFEEARVGGGWWRSPVALYSRTTQLNAGVTWSGAVGGDAARQLWPYEHTDGRTVLPSDAITIGNTIYLHAMVNEPFPNVTRTEIWKSDDNGATWTFTGATFPQDAHGGLFQLLTDPAAYQPWGYRDGAWAWGNPATPILTGQFGEMCLRPLGGRWVLTWFNEGDYRIDGILMDTPTSNLYEAYRRTLLWGTSWGNEDDSHVAQLYGGYIIPGSTIDELHLSVSQWNTAEDWPYRVMQFRVRGFGA